MITVIETGGFMPHYPVLQPDGKLAIWSTIVDHFLAFDCTQDEAVQELSQYHTGPIAETVRRTAAGEIPFEWCQDWADCVAEAHWRHGAENEAVQEAMTRTPDPMMRRYIGMCVATSKAEIAADDLRDALTAATARAEAAEATTELWRTDYEKARVAEMDARKRGAKYTEICAALTDERDEWKRRAEQAEAALAAVPMLSIAHLLRNIAEQADTGIDVAEWLNKQIKVMAQQPEVQP